jgi:hypothetical protein
MFHLSPDLFYGSPGPQSRYLETPRKCDPRIFLKDRRLSLLGPSRTWKLFDRQDEALTYVKLHPGNGLMTFVNQASDSGHRTFLVAHPKEFWLHDIEKQKSTRCSYEVIPEFTPCKLYMDLEFETEFNPNHNGLEMTELLIKILSHRLFQLYHLKIDRSMILDLDSSTPLKFSRHLIYQIPFLCFASNYEVGLLIQDIAVWIWEQDNKICGDLEISKEQLKQLIVKDRHGKDKLFCDTGVYSKNRHFRLYGSTKPHKNSHLEVSPQNKYTVPYTDPKLKEEAIFLASLVTNFEPIDIIVPFPERSLHCKSPISTRDPGSTSSKGESKNLPSPFPILDKFALDEMELEGIRCWIYFSSTQCLVYEGYRPGFCGNIGRKHKSNKGMLVIDLRQYQFYRKCHDPDCINYHSEPKSLPSYVVTSLQHPECSEEQRKEIKELLEFLESNDMDISLLECQDMNMSIEENYSQISVGDEIKDMSLIEQSSQESQQNSSQSSSVASQNSLSDVYDSEVKDIIKFLESQPNLDIT